MCMNLMLAKHLRIIVTDHVCYTSWLINSFSPPPPPISSYPSLTPSTLFHPLSLLLSSLLYSPFHCLPIVLTRFSRLSLHPSLSKLFFHFQSSLYLPKHLILFSSPVKPVKISLSGIVQKCIISQPLNLQGWNWPLRRPMTHLNHYSHPSTKPAKHRLCPVPILGLRLRCLVHKRTLLQLPPVLS